MDGYFSVVSFYNILYNGKAQSITAGLAGASLVDPVKTVKYMFNARANNAGWRIDYFVVSSRLAEKIKEATIHPDVMGSDHCPVGLELDL